MIECYLYKMINQYIKQELPNIKSKDIVIVNSHTQGDRWDTLFKHIDKYRVSKSFIQNGI